MSSILKRLTLLSKVREGGKDGLLERQKRNGKSKSEKNVLFFATFDIFLFFRAPKIARKKKSSGYDKKGALKVSFYLVRANEKSFLGQSPILQFVYQEMRMPFQVIIEKTKHEVKR